MQSVPRRARFQSTLPVGGATKRLRVRRFQTAFQSTLPVGGATAYCRFRCYFSPISIHAPRGGSDLAFLTYNATHKHFNPRSPWGERQTGCTMYTSRFLISIHAPRGGSDIPRGGALRENVDFNPRSPWGERLCGSAPMVLFGIFQSTLPVGGATRMIAFADPNTGISIHAPRGGSDLTPLIPVPWTIYFNPRSPWGERL